MKKTASICLLICLSLQVNAQLLWRVSGKDLKEASYLFGTYHLSPISIKDSIAGMPQAMRETTQVYGEVVMDELMNPATMQTVQQMMLMPADTTLQSLFTPEQYDTVAKVIKDNMMIDASMLSGIKPAALTQQLVVLLYMKHTPDFNPQMQLDSYFQEQAKQDGKKVGGLESIQSQIDLVYNKQSLQRQADLLYCLASNVDKTIEQSKQLITAYQKQDLKTVLALMEEQEGNSCDPLPGEMEAMLNERNQAWMEEIPSLMTEAPTLFVIGAGHLPGESGLINLLKQQGYVVEPMK